MVVTRYCVFDFETYSEAPLSEVGAFEYAAHPSTRILCGAWQVLDEGRKPLGPVRPVKAWQGEGFERLLKVLSTPGMVAVAHNLMFERALCEHVLGFDLELEACEDTAVLASAYGLPRALEKAAEALGLLNEKDSGGKKLIKALSVPNGDWHDDSDYEALLKYCEQDVRTQVELFQRVPLLSPVDREYWLTNLRMNLRGFLIDRDFAEQAVGLLDTRYKAIDREFSQITGLSTARKTAATLTWLQKQGYTESTLTKQAIRDFTTTNPKIARVLELRAQMAKTAVKKYKVMLDRSGYDGRARDTTIFYGAHTGRDAGVGLQPQNLPKSSVKRHEADVFIDKIKMGKIPPSEKVISILSDCVRGAITAAPGRKLSVWDFAKIELCVLFWMAGHEEGLKAIREGRDLYREMAAVIFGKATDQVTGEERALGKQVVLGAGYGIGVNGIKFQAAAKTYGIDIPLDLAQRAIVSYRHLHAPVPEMWKSLEKACSQAVLYPGKSKRANGVLAFFERGAPLTIRLPSGRFLFYQEPRVERKEGAFGTRYELTFRGVHGPAKKYERRTTWGGTLTENVVQAVARDVLYDSLVRLEGIAETVLAVHDEIVAEVPEDFNSGLIEQIMTKVPAWANGLPIGVEGWEGKRYGK